MLTTVLTTTTIAATATTILLTPNMPHVPGEGKDPVRQVTGMVTTSDVDDDDDYNYSTDYNNDNIEYCKETPHVQDKTKHSFTLTPPTSIILHNRCHFPK